MSGVDPAELGVDTGGTFTDFVTRDGRVAKIPSDAQEPGRVLESGARRLFGEEGRPPKRDPLVIVHGTTVATNALLTGDLAKTGFLVTRGFRDLLAIGRQARPDLYALSPQPAFEAPNRRFIIEVDERLDADGAVVEPLDEAGLIAGAERLKARGVEALALCFLHSWINPKQERAAGRLLKNLGLPVCLSSEVVPEFREFERASTTYANAALTPLLEAYVARLRARLEPLRRRVGSQKKPRVHIMQSSGGLTGLDGARRDPVRLALSGPAGGLVGAWAARGGRERLVTLDMGGTSTDVALLDDGLPQTGMSEIAGRPLLVPSLDLHTVGAGGGSIARIDASGALVVGPESAGARPGPACYGYGGPMTVTDANVFLRRIPPGRFLGGSMQLDEEAAQARTEALSEALGMSPLETALGVIRIAEATMARALRTISLERGHDPRRFALVAFGGAGALHAAALAEQLEMPETIVPGNPGLLSAEGMLAARASREESQTALGLQLSDLEADANRAFAELLRRGERALKRDGLDPEAFRVERVLDLRYAGQSYELSLPFRASRGGNARRFVEAHRRRFGFDLPGVEVELVTLRLTLRAAPPRRRRRQLAPQKGRLQPQEIHSTGFAEGWIETPVYDRATFGLGARLEGPAVIAEYSATTLLPPGQALEVEGEGRMVLRSSDA